MRFIRVLHAWMMEETRDTRRVAKYAVTSALHGHFTIGGSEERIASTLPPVFSPKIVPRS